MVGKLILAALAASAPVAQGARPMEAERIVISSGLSMEDLSLPKLQLTSWESHGELMDSEQLKQPAISDDLLATLATSASTWTAGHNSRFANATLADAKVLLGLLQDPSRASWLEAREYTVEELEGVPAELDWRTDPRAATCPTVKEVRDQANCGSCWAFGSVEAMSDRRCIASKGADKSHLSAQDVASCCNFFSGHPDMGCGGGIPATVYSYYNETGIVTGGDYGDHSMCYAYELAPCSHHTNSTKYPPCPAEVSAPKCAKKCDSASNGLEWTSDKKHGSKGHSVCGILDSRKACMTKMMAEIYNNGPITAMFFVHQDFLAYKSGVYQHTKGSMLGGHAIKILGYGTESGVDYWLVANSWNESWGDGGFFKIKRGVDECQIENALLDGGPVAGLPTL